MKTASPPFASGFPPSVRWSMYAGIYAFLCSTVLLLVLSPVSNTLVKILGLSTEFSTFLLAGPVPVVGAAVWWTVVERRGGYAYRNGVVFGLSTALLTVLFWVLVLATKFGSLVLIGGIVILFVLVMALPVASIAGLLLMYARRRLDDRLTDGKEG